MVDARRYEWLDRRRTERSSFVPDNLRKRNFDNAVKRYNFLVRANQATCEVLIEYAVTLELMGDYSGAVSQLPRIEEKLGDNSENLGNFGWLLADLGMYETGIKHLERAITRAPGLKQWQRALALILSEDGQIETAANYAKELTEMNPYDGPMWAARSMVESLAGNYATSALEYAEQAVEQDPFGFNENQALAFARSGLGDHVGAIEAMERIPEGERDDDIYHRCLGHFQALVGDSGSAVESLREAIKITDPAIRPKIFALHGVALLAQGSQDEARKSFESGFTARSAKREYKADDELAFALCELGSGRTKSGISNIQENSNKYRQMRGLLSETSALLKLMQNCGVAGSDQCITSIAKTLDTGSQ